MIPITPRKRRYRVGKRHVRKATLRIPSRLGTVDVGTAEQPILVERVHTTGPRDVRRCRSLRDGRPPAAAIHQRPGANEPRLQGSPPRQRHTMLQPPANVPMATPLQHRQNVPGDRSNPYRYGAPQRSCRCRKSTRVAMASRGDKEPPGIPAAPHQLATIRDLGADGAGAHSRDSRRTLLDDRLQPQAGVRIRDRLQRRQRDSAHERSPGKRSAGVRCPRVAARLRLRPAAIIRPSLLARSHLCSPLRGAGERFAEAMTRARVLMAGPGRPRSGPPGLRYWRIRGAQSRTGSGPALVMARSLVMRRRRARLSAAAVVAGRRRGSS